jgi:hypothetical protein
LLFSHTTIATAKQQQTLPTRRGTNSSPPNISTTLNNNHPQTTTTPKNNGNPSLRLDLHHLLRPLPLLLLKTLQNPLRNRRRRNHYLACTPCLRTQFFSAQENEINYPVKWQKHTLHPKQFPGAFSQTFVRAYEAKEVEYKAPALERVYCECGTFVAPMVGEDARMSWKTLASSKLCPGCEARWCLRCAQRCGGFGVPHECVPERRLGERRLALGGLKKGKDFQICPGEGCGRTIQLAEACNAMTCQCGTGFCYICGEQAEPESEHWMRADGGCPRYGIAGSGRAMFDDDFGNADDEANAEAAFVLEEREVWERGEGESTTFDFIRWAWQATMAEDTARRTA